MKENFNLGLDHYYSEYILHTGKNLSNANLTKSSGSISASNLLWETVGLNKFSIKGSLKSQKMTLVPVMAPHLITIVTKVK